MVPTLMSVPSFSGLLFISPKHHLKATLRFQLAVSYNWHIEKQPKSALAHSPPRAAPWAFTCESTSSLMHYKQAKSHNNLEIYRHNPIKKIIDAQVPQLLEYNALHPRQNNKATKIIRSNVPQ
ncbi:hypothetical protein ATG66_4024 [Vibrio sp. ES.051]|nr:hypothetical protein ATG66_4024 [Vibrio sp. ES.051]